MIQKILMIDDDVLFLKSWSIKLKENYSVVCAKDIEQGLEIIQKRDLDLVTLDVHLDNQIGLDFIQEIRKIKPTLPIVVISGDTDTKVIVKAIRQGANDYLRKPFSKNEFQATLDKMEKFNVMTSQNEALKAHIKTQDTRSMVEGKSKAFASLMEQVSKIKGYDVNVMIEGESGCGKEVMARKIHNLEEDAERPFVTLNCAAIPENLFETELFGHEKGAFSGASKAKAGLIELANGGDLFLDEINSLKYESQAKLLRVLEEKSIRRIGGTQEIPVNFRLITATNFPLEKLVQEGKFREDLYHRLKVLSFKIPALRDRSEDIPDLVQTFVQEFSDSQSVQFEDEVFETLQAYSWPGNIRELKNLVQRLIILSDSEKITKKDLPDWVKTKAQPMKSVYEQLPTADFESLKNFVKQQEKAYIKRALVANDYNKEETAKKLSISRSSLFLKLKEHSLNS